jgi:hypothetical protein
MDNKQALINQLKLLHALCKIHDRNHSFPQHEEGEKTYMWWDIYIKRI